MGWVYLVSISALLLFIEVMLGFPVCGADLLRIDGVMIFLYQACLPFKRTNELFGAAVYSSNKAIACLTIVCDCFVTMMPVFDPCHLVPLFRNHLSFSLFPFFSVRSIAVVVPQCIISLPAVLCCLSDDSDCVLTATG